MYSCWAAAQRAPLDAFAAGAAGVGVRRLKEADQIDHFERWWLQEEDGTNGSIRRGGGLLKEGEQLPSSASALLSSVPAEMLDVSPCRYS